MKLSTRKVLRRLATGVTVGLLAKLGAMLLNYWASGVSSLPSARFRWLMGQAFSADKANIADQEYFAILDANMWFVDVVIPAAVAVVIGILLGLFWHITLRTVTVAAVAFAFFDLFFSCCTLQPSELFGTGIFLFVLAGAQQIAHASKQRLFPQSAAHNKSLERTAARATTPQP